MKKKLVIVSSVLACLICSNAQAQKNFAPSNPRILNLEKSSSNEQFSFPEIENFDGSYQFIVKQKRDFLITKETFDKIEASRLQSEDTTISLNEYLDVFVYSKQKTQSKTFVPFKTTYIFK